MIVKELMYLLELFYESGHKNDAVGVRIGDRYTEDIEVKVHGDGLVICEEEGSKDE